MTLALNNERKSVSRVKTFSMQGGFFMLRLASFMGINFDQGSALLAFCKAVKDLRTA